MTRFKNAVRRFTTEESGATMVEYAIMIALIAAICIAVIKVIGNKSNNAFSNVNAVL
jgi:pilus assembly protein Flp/PilA